MAPVYGGNLNMNVGGAENKVQLIKSLISLYKFYNSIWILDEMF